MMHPAPSDEPYPGEMIQTPDGGYMMSEHPDDMDEMPDRPPEDQRPRPHPHGPMGPDGRAAHLRMKSGDMGLDLKCPETEPVKACVDAVMPLIDKLSAIHH